MIRGMVMNRNNKETFIPKTGTGMSFSGKQQLINEEREEYNMTNIGLDKKKVKKLICKAIDNIPDCAEIVDCYTEHSFMDTDAYIMVHVKVKEETDENVVEFHDIAHDAFGTDMGFIS